MTRSWMLDETRDDIDLGLTLEDVMRDLDPGWLASPSTAAASAADVAALLAVLS